MRRVLIEDLLENSQADVGQDLRDKSFFPNSGKFQKYFYEVGSIGDRSGKVWLGSSGISNSGLPLSPVLLL